MARAWWVEVELVQWGLLFLLGHVVCLLSLTLPCYNTQCIVAVVWWYTWVACGSSGAMLVRRAMGLNCFWCYSSRPTNGAYLGVGIAASFLLVSDAPYLNANDALFCVATHLFKFAVVEAVAISTRAIKIFVLQYGTVLCSSYTRRNNCADKVHEVNYYLVYHWNVIFCLFLALFDIAGRFTTGTWRIEFQIIGNLFGLYQIQLYTCTGIKRPPLVCISRDW